MSGSDSDFRAGMLSWLVHEKLEKYLRAMPGFLKDLNGSAKLVLEQSLKELDWAAGRSGLYKDLHEKLLAKDKDAWLFYLSLVDQCGFAGFQKAKSLSPFRDSSLYVKRTVSGTKIVLDPTKLDGVRVL